MKKKLLLALTAVLLFSLPSLAQLSSTVLVIRQSDTGVLTIQQAPTPASYVTSLPSGPAGQFFSDLVVQDGSVLTGQAQLPTDFFWTYLEVNLIKYPGQPFPLNSQGLMLLILQHSPGDYIFLVATPDDPSLTGPYVAFTSSLSTAENAIRDKLYLGL